MAQSPDSPDVCIRGDGIVGRVLALLLARERLRVALVSAPSAEPARAQGHGDVRAYSLNAASKKLLEGLGCWPNEQGASAVLRMEVAGDAGGQLSFDASAQGVPALNWIVDVPALQACLAGALRYQALIETVTEPVPCALTVICEGRASRSRAELGVEFELTPYPQHAIATRVQCEMPHGQTARQWFNQGEILAFLPLADAHSLAVVWSVQQERVADLLALEAAEFAQALEAASGAALGPLRLIAERASWPLQLARASRWIGEFTNRAGSWALVGDAAHTLHPLAGQGLNLGLADAAGLAQVLQQREDWRGLGDRRLLRRYERARQAPVRAMGLATDGLQTLFAQPGEPWRGLRNWGMRGFDRCDPLKAWVARQAAGEST